VSVQPPPPSAPRPDATTGAHTPDVAGITPFVARETELRRLREFIDRPSSSGGALVFITGEAGIGKTRLMDEARRYASEQGVICLSARCEAVEREVPYALWTDLLRESITSYPRSAVRTAVGPRFDALLKLLPDLADRVWLIPRPGTEVRELGAVDFVRQLADYFGALAASVRSLITIDDLALADEASLELLRRVALRNAVSPLRLILSARDSQFAENPRLRELLASLSREKRATELSLGRLDTVQVGQLIAGVLVEHRVNPRFVEVVSQKSEGNPFYIEEILASLIEQGAIVRSETGWEGPPADAIRIPAGIRSLIHLRLLRLSDQDVSILRSASVLGNSFSAEVVKSMLNLSDASLVESIEGALTAKLLREGRDASGALRYAFSHPLIGEVLLEDLSLLRRTQLHLAAAHALEQGPSGSAPERTAALAYHYLRGGDPSRALEHSIAAGDYAARIYARRAAIDHYRTALRLFDAEPPSRRRWEVQERLADQALAAGEDLEASHLYETAAEGFIEQQDPVRAAECLVKQIDSGHPHPDQAHEVLRRARGLLRGDAHSATFCRVQLQTAHMLYREGRVQEAHRVALKNLDLAVQLGLATEEVSSCLELAKTLPPGRMAEVRRLIDRALRTAESHRLDELVAKARGWQSIYLVQAEGRINAAIQSFVRVLEANRKVGNLGDEVEYQGFGIGGTLYFHGDYAAAAEAAASASRESAAGERGPRPHAFVLRAIAAVAQGDDERATRLLSQSMERLRACPYWYLELITELSFARFELNRDRPGSAGRHLGRARAIGLRAGPSAWHASFFVLVLASLVQFDLRSGSRSKARTHLAELEHLAQELDTEYPWGFVFRAQAQCSAAAGEFAVARRRIRQSIDILDRLGWRYELAGAWEDLATILRLEGKTGASAEPCRHAEELFQNMGAQPDLARLQRSVTPDAP
jgi:tetratricopeptide (TPR) repeat protein